MQDSEKYIFCNLKEASNYKKHPVDNLWVQPDASYFVYYLNTEIIAIYFLHTLFTNPIIKLRWYRMGEEVFYAII
jgi:hypothetical protein